MASHTGNQARSPVQVGGEDGDRFLGVLSNQLLREQSGLEQDAQGFLGISHASLCHQLIDPGKVKLICSKVS